MATKAWVFKANQEPKFSTRRVRRCQLCGRSRGVYRKFKVCRICLRELAHKGLVPGIRKASW
ncbi:MAG: type Z 30S ribosomal protein S14 [Phycisphaerales bacterium]|nr:MAG: type Z 30S ribosomal protein S14 [Phycisphaerales bacterium]